MLETQTILLSVKIESDVSRASLNRRRHCHGSPVPTGNIYVIIIGTTGSVVGLNKPCAELTGVCAGTEWSGRKTGFTGT